MTTTELTVEQCLKELREMFPYATFISVKAHAIHQLSWEHRPQSDIQVEDVGFRRETLTEAMAQVRKWYSEQQEISR